MAYGLGMLAATSLTGAAAIPGQWAAVDQAYSKAVELCRQTRWTMHRTEQLNTLSDAVEEDIELYLDPAADMAAASVHNWERAKKTLAVDKVVMYVNAGILAVAMVVYVLLAWFCLFRKRQTLQDAFSAVRNIHISGGGPRA